MMGINAQAEQVVIAQNMTANMTDSADNSTGTNDTGSISGLASTGGGDSNTAHGSGASTGGGDSNTALPDFGD
jgi:hypothetical protein